MNIFSLPRWLAALSLSCASLSCAALLLAAPASAQAGAALYPGATQGPRTQGSWSEPDAIAQLEAAIAVSVHQGDSSEALAVIESADLRPLDRGSLTRLVRAAQRLEPPGSEPGWLWGGIGLAGLGLAGAIVTPLAYAFDSPCASWFSDSSCVDTRSDAPLVAGLVLSGAALATGLSFLVVFLVRHVFDPERRRFNERRRTVIEELIETRAAIRW